jgi:putative membrane protein
MVEVTTAGQDGKVKLNYLGHREAKTVREQILARIAARRTRQDPVHQGFASRDQTLQDPDPQRPDLRDPALAAVPSVVAGRLEDFTDLDVDEAVANSLVTVPVGRLIGATLLSWETMIFSAVIAIAIGMGVFADPLVFIALVPISIAFGATLISGFTRNMNFHLSLGAQGMRVSAGLISTITETIPRGKIHAISVRQPLGWRPFGWWQVRITTAGLSTSSNNAAKTVMSTMLPVGKFDDVLRVLDVVIPGHGMSPDDVREGLVGTSGGYLGSPVRAAWLLWFSRSRNGLRLAPNGEAIEPNLRLRRGFFTRLLVIIPITRLQSIQLYRGPLHYPLRLASLTAHTVLGPVPTRIAGLDLVQSRDALDDIAAAAIDAAQADVRGAP